MKLSKKQIIKFCDETIAEINKGETHFLCNALKDYIQNKTFWGKLFGFNKDLSKHIPEFTNKNAVKHANAETVDSNEKPWWPVDYINFVNNRIPFLEWIKAQYTTPKEK